MSIHIPIRMISTILFVFLINGCGSENTPRYQSEYTYHGIHFGHNLSPDLKQGIRDGCETSRGTYTKSHTLFNDNNDYYNGWFRGRNRCRHLLKINKDGNLIL